MFHSHLFQSLDYTEPDFVILLKRALFVLVNMLGPLNIALDQFGISPRTGFLPEEQPLRRLNQYYKDWEDIVDEVPALLRNKTIRFKAERLPLLSVLRLQTEREWQRAYVLLSFITHSYIWGGHRPAEVCH